MSDPSKYQILDTYEAVRELLKPYPITIGRSSVDHDFDKPDPTDLMPEWFKAIPTEAWANSAESGESVAASHANSMTILRYREMYIDLHNQGFEDKHIQKIFSIAHDFSMDYREVADQLRAARNMNLVADDAGRLILIGRKPTATFDARNLLLEAVDKMPEADVASSSHLRYLRKEGKKKFSQSIEETFREARRNRTKKENKKRRRS